MCLAIPGKIIEIQAAENELFRVGSISFDGMLREVNLAAVPEAKVGDYVLVHVGMALNIIDEDEANKTLDYFRELDQMDNEPDNDDLTD